MRIIALITLIAVFVTFLAVSSMAENKQNDVDSDVYDKLNNEQEVGVIIEFKNVPESDLQDLGSDFKKRHKFNSINAVSGKLTKQGLKKLENDPRVKKVFIDRKVEMLLAESIPLIHANAGHASGYNGTGIRVCVLDTGINYNNPALQGKVIAQRDFVNDDNDAIDDNGHGTQVAGVIASQNSTYRGVAPGADLLAVKVLDSQGNGFVSDVVAGIEWCVNQSADVISISFGGGLFNNYCDFLPDAQAINNAVDSGIFVAAASGNDANKTHIIAPACASKAVSVGATYDANVGGKIYGDPVICYDSITFPDKIACFTNRNNMLDILAPGAMITTTAFNPPFVEKAGTSFAAPHVSGAAALLLQNNPSRTPSEIETILKATGVSVYDSGTGITFSRLDVLSALETNPGYLDTFIDEPMSNISVMQGKTFNITANLRCVGGFCGDINVTLKTPAGNVPVSSGNPFYTINPNPAVNSCLQSVVAGTVCSIKWTLNATGNPGINQEFFASFSSNFPSVHQNETNRISISIIPWVCSSSDQDNDGLSECQEIELGTNPNNPDTDNDNLNDGQEISLGTNPLNNDTDSDGIKDGTEVNGFTLPNGIKNLTNNSFVYTNPLLIDTDGDGCKDGKEIGNDQTQGGKRDPTNPWDYFNPQYDGMNRIEDIVAVVTQYYIDVGHPNYTDRTDRTFIGPNLWNLGPPDGEQRIEDIVNAVNSYYHDCVDAGVTSISIVSDQSIDKGRIAYWNLDENKSTNVKDKVQNITGTLKNGPIWISGLNGSALKFDGINDYVEVKDNSNLERPTNAITVESWIKMEQQNSAGNIFKGIVSKRFVGSGAWGSPFFSYSLHTTKAGDANSEKITFWLSTSRTTAVSIISDKIPRDGKYHHVVGTYDGTKMRLYIDGELSAEKANSAAIVYNSGTQSNDYLMIGGWLNDGIFKGSVDEVVVYDRALTAEEAQYKYVTSVFPALKSII